MKSKASLYFLLGFSAISLSHAAPEWFEEGITMGSAQQNGLLSYSNGSLNTMELFGAGGLILNFPNAESSKGSFDGGVNILATPISLILSEDSTQTDGVLNVWRGSDYSLPSSAPVFQINTLANTAKFDSLNVSIVGGSLMVGGSSVLTASSASGTLSAQGFITTSSLGNTLRNMSQISVGNTNTVNNSAGSSMAVGMYNTVSGVNAFGAGYMTISSGYYSFAVGNYAYATGDHSFAAGTHSQAIGEGAFAGGYSTIAGRYAMAAGGYTEASGEYAFSVGLGSKANGYTAMASGYNTKATGGASMALGYQTEANGQASLSAGYGSKANKGGSVAIGYGLIANTFSETVVGMYNNPIPAFWPNGSNPVEAAFEIGNGTSDTDRSNAVVVLKNGQTTLSNKAWNASNPTLVTSDPNFASGNALVVEGHSNLKGNARIEGNSTLNGITTLNGLTTVNGNTVLNGTVLISQPQGDISMGIYE